MKSCIALVLALYSTYAFAGTLPIAHSYCAANGSGGEFVALTSTGIRGEDDLQFDKITKVGARSWTVTYKGADYADWSGRVSLSRDRKTATVTGTDGTFVLHRCPS